MNVGLERAFECKDMVTTIFVLVFLLLSVVKLKFPNMFIGLVTSLFSNVFFLDYSNDLKSTFSSFKFLFFFIQNLIFSLFVFVLFRKYDILKEYSEWGVFGIILLGLSLFLITQYLLSFFVSKVFGFVEVFQSFHIYKFTYLKLVALSMLPFLLLLNYASFHNLELLVVISLVFFVFFMLLRAVFVLIKNNKVIIENLFYFIVYLCTLEIIPLLLIFKLVVNK